MEAQLERAMLDVQPKKASTMDLKEGSRRYEFTAQDADEIAALFADLKKGVDAFEWMLSTTAGETLTHHFELAYLLRNIKMAIDSSAGRLPRAACVLSQGEMYSLLCEGPLLALTGGITTAVTFVKLSGQEGMFVRVVMEGLSESERRLVKFMERPHEERVQDPDGAKAEHTGKPRTKKRASANGTKPPLAHVAATALKSVKKAPSGKAA
jgi:hypothetical protein